MDDDERTRMPSNPVGEWGLVVAKAAVSLIPFAGGSAAEVLGAIIQPVIERRKIAWFEGIAKGLDNLSKQVVNLTPERLAQDEAFTTAFLHASQIAMRTQQQEKLEALRNSVLNVAAGTAPDASVQLMFLNALDTLTPWHLILLDCIADPSGWAASRQYPLAPGYTPDASNIFEAFFRDKLPIEGFDGQLLQDLYNRGLAANNVNPRGQLFPQSPETVIPHITSLGREFLRFVVAPVLSSPPSPPQAEESQI
jgi:hypothetical protein